MLRGYQAHRSARNAMILIAYLNAVEIMLIKTRLGDLKISWGAKDLGYGIKSR